MSKFEWSGLDEENAAQQENFIMRKAWSDGLIACRRINNTDNLAFTTWTTQTLNMYDFPETVMLINLRGVSQAIIPATPQVVNKEVVIGWFQPNRKPIQEVVRYYVDRMTQVELIINTNLTLQNMPFLVAVNEEDKERLEDIVNRITRNEIVVYTSMEDLSKVQTMATQTPYIIDKLRAYEQELEDELLAYLGVDNNGGNNYKSHLTVDAVNANNDLINEYNNSITSEMNKWIDQINKLFGRNISIKEAVVPELDKIRSIHDQGGMEDENISE